MNKHHTNMPVLKDFRQLKKISLPNYEGSELEIYNGMLAGNILFSGKELNNAEILVNYIKDWNFTNEKDEKLQITAENLKLFDAESIAYLIQEVNKFVAEKKKV